MTDHAIALPASAPAARTGNQIGRRFNDLRFAHKLASLVTLLLVLTSAVGGLAISDLSKVAAGTAAMSSGNLAPTAQLADVRAAVAQTQAELASIVIATSDTSMAMYRKAMLAQDAIVDKQLAVYATTADPGAQQTLVDQAKAAWSAFIDLRTNTLLPLALKSNNDAYLAAYEAQATPVLDKLAAALDGLDSYEVTAGAKATTGADSTYKSARLSIIGLLVGALLIGAGLAWLVARSVVGTLKKVNDVLSAVAEGDLTRHVDVDSHDELGQMASSLNLATESLRATIRGMSDSAHSLAAASEELATTSNQIAGSAQETSAQAGVVATAAEQVSMNVQTVAAGTEEMGASIREIAQNAADAARVAAQAVSVAASTNVTMTKLGDSSTEIGAVIKVITSIAEQTNLLALNATIEAARAGEAGKGFAVVANEVKDLAQETAKATEDISRRIEAIQSDTHGAVSAIGEISDVIGRINDYQTTIAAAVEEQTATTNEMARNVAEAATGSADIAQNVVGVATAAELTTAAVGETQNAAADLARMSSELQALVGQFRY